MGKVIAVCISEKKGTQKHRIQSAEFVEDWGIKGDAHAGKWHRQVSLLSLEKIDAFRARGAEVEDGAFGENLVVEGFDFSSLPVGTRFRCGDVLLEAVRIGAGGPASDAYKGEKVCTPMEPWFVFCQILEAGRLREGEIILQQR